MKERVWSNGRIILTGKNQNTWRKTWPSATLSTTKPIQTALQVNLRVCGERATTKSQPSTYTGKSDLRKLSTVQINLDVLYYM
jgi:hypothetical protein